MQLSADWLITTGHLTLLALSVLFCSSEDELPESGVNQGILTVRGSLPIAADNRTFPGSFTRAISVARWAMAARLTYLRVRTYRSP
jgi:hypothetical protein